MKHIRLGILVCSVVLFYASPATSAEHLNTFLSGLYGGNGIILDPIPGNPVSQGHVAHFTGSSLVALEDLNNSIVASIGSFAFNSTVSGITFDVNQGVPVRVEDSMGPLLAERATTLGAGKLNLSFSFSRIDYDELDGVSLSELQVVLPHQDSAGDGLKGYELDTMDVHIDARIRQNVFAFFASYGLTEKWDVGAIVPVIDVKVSASAIAQIHYDPANVANPVHTNEPVQDSFSGSKTGLGDVIFRTKYQVSDSDSLSLAVLGQVTLPSGQDKDLLGTGESAFKGMLIASRRGKVITPHLNVGYEISTGSSELDNLSYAAGFDTRLSDSVTVGADILGHYNPDSKNIGNHRVDGAAAIKWNPFNNYNAPFNAFVIVPLNKDGLRADVIWGLGIDFIF